jgi:hypothetical protein
LEDSVLEGYLGLALLYAVFGSGVWLLRGGLHQIVAFVVRVGVSARKELEPPRFQPVGEQPAPQQEEANEKANARTQAPEGTSKCEPNDGPDRNFEGQDQTKKQAQAAPLTPELDAEALALEAENEALTARLQELEGPVQEAARRNRDRGKGLT